MPGPKDITDQLKRLHLELGNTANSLGTLIKSQDATTASSQKMTRAQADLAKGLTGTVGELGKAGKAWTSFGKSVEGFGNQMKSTSGLLLALPGMLAAPTKAMDGIGGMFESAFKRVGEFKQGIRSGVVSMQAMGKEFSNTAETSKVYNSAINDISASTYLTREQSEKMFTTLMKGAKGARGGIIELADKTKVFTGQAAAMQNIVKLTGNLGLAAGEAARQQGILAEAVGKTIVVQKALEDFGKASGKQTGKNIGELMELAAAGVISEDVVSMTIEAGSRGQVKEKDTATIGALQKNQLNVNAKIAVDEKTASSKMAELTLKGHAFLADIVTSNAGIFSAMQQVSKGAEIAGTGLGVTGSITSKAVSLMQGGHMAQVAGGLLGKIKGPLGALGRGVGSLGGVASGVGAMMADATPVRVVNFHEMGVGGMGLGNLMGGGKGGGLAKSGGKLARMGKGVMKGLKIGGPLALLAAGASAYSTYNDPALEAAGLTKRERATRAAGTAGGGLAGGAAGAAAGAAIGSIVPIIGTAIGGLIGGALGYWGGSSAGSAMTSGVGKEKIAAMNTPEALAKAQEEAAFAAMSNEEKAAKRKQDIDKKILTAAGDVMAGWQEVKRTAFAPVEKAKMKAGVAGGFAETAAGFGVGFGELAAEQYAKQSEQLEIQSQAEMVAAKTLRIQQKTALIDAAKLREKAKGLTGDEKEVAEGTAKALEGAAAGLDTQAAVKELESLQSALKKTAADTGAATIELQKRMKGADAETRLAEAQQAYNKELRLGQGRDFIDSINVTKKKSAQAEIQREDVSRYAGLETEAKKKAAQYGLANDTKNQKIQLEVAKEFGQKKLESTIKATNLEREAVGASRDIREGYLDALREEVSDAGGYAELVFSMGSGNQFALESMRTGAGFDLTTGRDTKVRGRSGPIKHTRQGIMQETASGDIIAIDEEELVNQGLSMVSVPKSQKEGVRRVLMTAAGMQLKGQGGVAMEYGVDELNKISDLAGLKSPDNIAGIRGGASPETVPTGSISTEGMSDEEKQVLAVATARVSGDPIPGPDGGISAGDKLNQAGDKLLEFAQIMIDLYSRDGDSDASAQGGPGGVDA